MYLNHLVKVSRSIHYHIYQKKQLFWEGCIKDV